MAGIDYLRAMVDGELPQPPIAGLMEFDDRRRPNPAASCSPASPTSRPTTRSARCTAVWSARCSTRSTGCALHSTLPQGKGYTSVEIKVNYLKAVRLSSGLLTATGTVVKAGSRVGFTEGVVTDASGAVVATATSTLLVFDL